MRDVLTNELIADPDAAREISWCGIYEPVYTVLSEEEIKARTSVCDCCGGLTKKGTRRTVKTPLGPRMWGSNCVSRRAVKMGNGRWIDPSMVERVHNGDTVILVESECIDTDTLDWCDEHQFWHVRDSCPLCAQARATLSVAAYGGHGAFRVHERHSFALGLEMEVAGVKRDQFERIWGFLGNDFAYPTRDSSLGPEGVEFIGHPTDIIGHWTMANKYDLFFEGLKGANVSMHPCGCHTSVHLDNFVSDEARAVAIVVTNRFADNLIKWTHRDQIARRSSYARKAELFTGKPEYDAGQLGKMTVANVKARESLLEFRIPGMQLDTRRHLQQVTMYHNMVAWSNRSTLLDACTATFSEVFGPFMFCDLMPNGINNAIKPSSYTREEYEQVIRGARILRSVPENVLIVESKIGTEYAVIDGDLYNISCANPEDIEMHDYTPARMYGEKRSVRYSMEPYTDLLGRQVKIGSLYLNPNGRIIRAVSDQFVKVKYKSGMDYCTTDASVPEEGDYVYIEGSSLTTDSMKDLGYKLVTGVCDVDDVLFIDNKFRYVVKGMAGSDCSAAQFKLYRKVG